MPRKATGTFASRALDNLGPLLDAAIREEVAAIVVEVEQRIAQSVREHTRMALQEWLSSLPPARPGPGGRPRAARRGARP